MCPVFVLFIFSKVILFRVQVRLSVSFQRVAENRVEVIFSVQLLSKRGCTLFRTACLLFLYIYEKTQKMMQQFLASQNFLCYIFLSLI